jgi:tetratricopeptide (TPR) repeat protein
MGSARLDLEQAIELAVTDPVALQLYQSAEKDLLEALKLESNNPVINSMLAIAYFGKYQIAQQAHGEDGNAMLRSTIRIATEAYRYRNQAAVADAMEIEGDFRFYQGRFVDAIAAYEKLAASESNEAARRAHWMLAALYAGDWGVQQSAESLVDHEKARDHAIAILALWPDSHEASVLRRELAWSDSSGKTLSPHLAIDKVAVPLDATAQQ